MRPRSGMSMTFDVKDVVGAFESMASTLEDPERPMNRLGAHMTRRIKKSMPSGGGEASKPGMFPHSQRGARGMRGTVVYNVLLRDTALEVGSSAIYAGVIDEGTEEEIGGPIRPKTAKALAIPIHKRSKNRSPRDFSDLTWRPNRKKTRTGRGVLGTGKGQRFVALFALVSEVSIEARPFLEFLSSDEEFAVKVVLEELALEDK